MMKNKGKIVAILQVFLWSVFFFAFLHVIISSAQTFKDIYYNLSAMALVLISLLYRKVKIYKLYNILILCICIGYMINFAMIHREDWGPHYAAVLATRQAMLVLCGLVIVDVLVTGKITSFRKNVRLFAVFTAVSFGIILIFDTENIVYVLCPIIACFLTPITADEWKKIPVKMSIAAYLVFIFRMTKSLIQAPTGFQNGRYVGTFMFPVACALISTFAFLAGIIIWKYFFSKTNSKARKIATLSGLLAYPGVMLLLCFNRATFLGIATMALFAFIFISRKNVKKRLVWSVGIAVALILMVCIAIRVIISTVGTVERQDSTIAESQEKSSKVYFIGAIAKTFGSGSRTGVYKAGSVLNALDYFSSGRLGLWHTGIRQVRVVGKASLDINLPDGEYYGHVHNTYIDWLLRYGLIGGICVITWFFVYMIVAVRKYLAGDNTLTYSLLWVAFSFSFFLVERELWYNIPAFLLLFLLYPLLIEFDDMREPTKRIEK